MGECHGDCRAILLNQLWDNTSRNKARELATTVLSNGVLAEGSHSKINVEIRTQADRCVSTFSDSGLHEGFTIIMTCKKLQTLTSL